MDKKRIVAYLKSSLPTQAARKAACEYQLSIIDRYCKRHGIEYESIYTDGEIRRSRRADEKGRADKLGISNNMGVKILPEWEKLMMRAMETPGMVILVDIYLRLHANSIFKAVLEFICENYGTEVIEAGSDFPLHLKKNETIVYHLSVYQGKRMTVVTNELDKLYLHAASLKRDVVGILLGHEFGRKSNFKRLSTYIGPATVLVKSFSHITRHAAYFLETTRNMWNNGVKVISKEDGELEFLCGDALFSQNFKVAIYDNLDSEYGERNADIRYDIFEVFVKLRTNWAVGVHIVDKSEKTDVTALVEKVKESGCDVLLIQSWNRISRKTELLCRTITKVPVVYALEEGGIRINGKFET